MARTIIRSGRLIDGTGKVEERAVVILEGEKIVAVARPDEAPEPEENDTVIDATSKVVMPGLIACHEHLTFMNTKGEYLKVVAEEPTYLTLRCVKSGYVLLTE